MICVFCSTPFRTCVVRYDHPSGLHPRQRLCLQGLKVAGDFAELDTQINQPAY